MAWIVTAARTVDLLSLIVVSVARMPPQHALQLLDGKPAPEPSARVLLGSLDERLAEALVEALAALMIG